MEREGERLWEKIFSFKETRLDRFPRVPHNCHKLFLVLKYVVFTYAILGSGGGVLLHSGERCSVEDLGLLVAQGIFFSTDIFLPVEDMGSVCGEARSGAGPGG